MTSPLSSSSGPSGPSGSSTRSATPSAQPAPPTPAPPSSPPSSPGRWSGLFGPVLAAAGLVLSLTGGMSLGGLATLPLLRFPALVHLYESSVEAGVEGNPWALNSLRFGRLPYSWITAGTAACWTVVALVVVGYGLGIVGLWRRWRRRWTVAALVVGVVGSALTCAAGAAAARVLGPLLVDLERPLHELGTDSSLGAGMNALMGPLVATRPSVSVGAWAGLACGAAAVVVAAVVLRTRAARHSE